MKPRPLGTLYLVLLVGSFATHAAAQVLPPSRASSNAIFGRPADQVSELPTLDLSGSLFGGYDDDIAAALSGRSTESQPTNSPGGTLSGGSASLAFSRPGERTTLSAAARGGVTHFPASNATAANYGADGSFSRQLTRSTALEFAGRFEYAPYYGLGTRLFATPNDFGLPTLDDGLRDFDQVAASAHLQHYQVGLSHRLGRRSTIDGYYRFRRTDFASVSRDLTAHEGSFRVNRQLDRYLTFRLGYGYTESRYEQVGEVSPTYGFHNIIATVDYDRSFSISMTKRTQFSFGFGSTVGQETRLQEGDTEPSSDPRLHLTGNARLSHDMGRTWNTGVTYSRDLRVLDGFGEPQLVDSVIAGLTGLLSRRVDFSAFARYGTGLSMSDRSQRFHQTQASTQIRVALNRRLSLFSQVFYSRFDSEFGSVLNPAVLQALSRYGARAGINLWSPLLNRRGVL